MVEDILNRYSRNGLMVDTNLLVLFVIGCVDQAYIPMTKRTSSFRAEDHDLLVAILSMSLGPRLTTPHILAETSNLVASAFTGEMRLKAMAILADQVMDHLQEHHIPGCEAVSDPFFLELGLTDTGIGTMRSRGCAVLTADGPLYARLSSRNIPTINFNHYRNLLG